MCCPVSLVVINMGWHLSQTTPRPHHEELHYFPAESGWEPFLHQADTEPASAPWMPALHRAHDCSLLNRALFSNSLCLIGGQLLYNMVLVFATHQHESAFSSVQLLSCVRLFVTPLTAAHQASLTITNSNSLLKLMSIESVMLSNHFTLCHPLLLLLSLFSSIRVFSNESALHIRWPKYWSFSFNISPSNEHSGLISSRMDWLDLLAVQGTIIKTNKNS